MTEAIPKYILAAAGRSLRFQVLAKLNEALAYSGVTTATLAKRLGRKEAKIKDLLEGRAELTLRDIGELFFAIDGSMPELTLRPRYTSEPILEQSHISPSTEEPNHG